MRWRDDLPIPRHPYRDSAIFYGVLAVFIIVVGVFTGGLAKGIVFAVGFFVAATAWSWWRFRQRLDEQERR
jgi:hypothetical protein